MPRGLSTENNITATTLPPPRSNWRVREVAVYLFLMKSANVNFVAGTATPSTPTRNCASAYNARAYGTHARIDNTPRRAHSPPTPHPRPATHTAHIHRHRQLEREWEREWRRRQSTHPREGRARKHNGSASVLPCRAHLDCFGRRLVTMLIDVPVEAAAAELAPTGGLEQLARNGLRCQQAHVVLLCVRARVCQKRSQY